MSLRMVSLWIVGALLVAATLKADPPQGEPAGIANQVKDKPVVPKPVPVASTDRRHVLFDVKVWDVDHAALKAITKTDMGMHEFYKAHGLIKQPDWISAAIGDLLAPPGRKGAAPAPLPVRAFAVQNDTVSKTLLSHDISSAFHTIAEPSLVATNGREASLLCGGEVPIFVPRTADPEVTDWHVFGLKMKLGEQLLVAQQTGKQDVTRLVQIQPTLIVEQQATTHQAQQLPDSKAVAAKPALSAIPERQPESPEEFNVIERWPIGNVEVGQVVYPLVITTRTQLTAQSSSIRDAEKSSMPRDKTICRVLAIDQAADGEGRIITLLPQGLSAVERPLFATCWRLYPPASDWFPWNWPSKESSEFRPMKTSRSSTPTIITTSKRLMDATPNGHASSPRNRGSDD